MSPSQSYEKLTVRFWTFLWKYLKNKKKYLFGLTFSALIWSLEISCTPYLLKTIIDTIIKYTHHPTQLFPAALIPCVLYASMSMIITLNTCFYDYLNMLLIPKLKMDINKNVTAHILGQPMYFFQDTHTGNALKKIADLSENVEQIFGIIFNLFLPTSMALLIASITFYNVIHPLFSLTLLVWSVMALYLTYAAAKKTETYSKQASESRSNMSGVISDSLSNIVNIKLFNNLSHEINNVDKNAVQVIADDQKLKLHHLKVNLVQGCSVTLFISLILTLLIFGIKKTWITPGDCVLVLSLSMSFVWYIFRSSNEIQRFSNLVGVCKQALSIIEMPHEIVDSSDAFSLVVSKGEIKFENVTFHYIDNPPLFNQLTVKINTGEKIGLVGYSGGGKSTFIKLILRLFDTQSGHIFIDNQDIKKVTQSSLRDQITLIQQEPELFHRTIMDNIRFAKIEATNEEVVIAAKKARCHEFILKLPEQYHTMVGIRGIKLSVGQKQRISIARAFLKDTPILLLDEITSSVDAITEKHIQDALHELMQSKTTLVIAHQLSTLCNMDRLLVFANGEIIEDGSMDKLLSKNHGVFYELWNTQAKGFSGTLKINM